MPVYQYKCFWCGKDFEDYHPVAHRDLPETQPCPYCAQFEVSRVLTVPHFTVPEGGVGNAANGYASTHGDAENFMARDKGEPLPYPKGKMD